MTLAVSLHKIILPDDTVLPAGKIYNFGDEYQDLKNMDAIRLPTDEERAAYGASKAARKTAAKVERVAETESVASKNPVAAAPVTKES